MDRGGKARRLSVRGVLSVVWIDWAKHKRPKIVGSAGGPKSAVRCSKIWLHLFEHSDGTVRSESEW